MHVYMQLCVRKNAELSSLLAFIILISQVLRGLKIPKISAFDWFEDYWSTLDLVLPSSNVLV